MRVASPCEPQTPPSGPRRPRIPVFLLLPLPLLLGPAWHAAAQRCPQTCVCDNARRHVSCRHQNLSEVPSAIPEVGRASGCGGGRTWGEPELAWEPRPPPGWGTWESYSFSLSLSLHIGKTGTMTNRETIYLASYVIGTSR